MKEISFIGEFSDPSFEGNMSVVRALKKEISTLGIKIHLNDYSTKNMHVHSNGFFSSFTLRDKIKEKKSILRYFWRKGRVSLVSWSIIQWIKHQSLILHFWHLTFESSWFIPHINMCILITPPIYTVSNENWPTHR